MYGFLCSSLRPYCHYFLVKVSYTMLKMTYKGVNCQCVETALKELVTV